MKTRHLTFAVAILIILAMAAVVSADPGDGGRGGNGNGNGRGQGQQEAGRRPENGDGAIHALINVISEETGLEPREVMEQVRADKTLAAIITENGITVQAVTDAAIEKATERVNEGVENGRLTQERADEILAEMPEQIDTLLNRDFTVFQFDPQQGRYLMGEVAQETGLNREELRDAVQSGKTLSAVLTDSGIDVAVFTDELVVEAETRLTDAVENGRLTQEEADLRLSHVRDNINEALEFVFPSQAQEV